MARPVQREERTVKAPGRVVLGLISSGALMGISCVVPVAPEFGDPEENYPPYIVDAVPAEGTEVTPPLNERPEFRVWVRDPNRGDRLYVRWMIDYPEYNERSRYAREDILPNTTDPGGTSVRFSPDCFQNSIALNQKMHRVTMTVADRPFVSFAANPPQEALLDTVPAGGFRQRATWVVMFECKAPSP